MSENVTNFQKKVVIYGKMLYNKPCALWLNAFSAQIVRFVGIGKGLPVADTPDKCSGEAKNMLYQETPDIV